MRKIYCCKSLPAVVGDQEALDSLFIAFGFYLIGKKWQGYSMPLEPMDGWKYRDAYRVPSSWFESGFMGDVIEFGSVSWGIEIVEVDSGELIRKARLLYRMRMLSRFSTLMEILIIAALVLYAGVSMWKAVAGLA